MRLETRIAPAGWVCDVIDIETGDVAHTTFECRTWAEAAEDAARWVEQNCEVPA